MHISRSGDVSASLSGRRALVTGGAGFIGSHLVEALVQQRARVRVLDDFSTGRREHLAVVAGDVEVVQGDVRSAEDCRRACASIEFVFHQAALVSVARSIEDPCASLAVNLLGSAQLLAAARLAGVQRLVYASSAAVYGDAEKVPAREGEEGEPLSPYALAKRATEVLARLGWALQGQETIGLRYFNVYGPRQDPRGPYSAVIPSFLAAWLREEAPTIFGDGDQTRDFVFVEDVVRANLLAAVAPPAACGRAYNVGSGEAVSISALAEAVRRVVRGTAPARHGQARRGEVRHSVADLTATRSALGFYPEVPLDEGLRRTRDQLALQV